MLDLDEGIVVSLVERRREGAEEMDTGDAAGRHCGPSKTFSCIIMHSPLRLPNFVTVADAPAAGLAVFVRNFLLTLIELNFLEGAVRGGVEVREDGVGGRIFALRGAGD